MVRVSAGPRKAVSTVPAERVVLSPSNALLNHLDVRPAPDAQRERVKRRDDAGQLDTIYEEHPDGGLALHQHETNVVTPGLETGRMAMRWYHSWRVGFRISQQLASHL